MMKEEARVLGDEELGSVSGGVWKVGYNSVDNRWMKYKFENNLALENEKLDAEVKKLWIKNGCKLGSDVIAAAGDLISSGITEKKKADAAAARAAQAAQGQGN